LNFVVDLNVRSEKFGFSSSGNTKDIKETQRHKETTKT